MQQVTAVHTQSGVAQQKSQQCLSIFLYPAHACWLLTGFWVCLLVQVLVHRGAKLISSSKDGCVKVSAKPPSQHTGRDPGPAVSC